MVRWMLVLAMLAPGVAMAQSAPQAGTPGANAFAAVMQDAGHRQEVLNAAQSTPVWQHMGCKTARFSQAPEVGVYAPMRFDSSGAPVAGEWREGILVSGCGPELRLNVLTKVTAPSTLATGALLPGGTIADPVLQNAAQFYAVRAAGGLPAGCKDAFVADTVFGGFDGKPIAAPAGEIAAPWREAWRLNFCGVEKDVVLRFLPDAQGVSISAVAGK